MSVKVKTREKTRGRQRRRQRVRKRILGSSERPRLSVFRSQHHIYAQAIDDVGGHTLVSASSLDKELGKDLSRGSTVEAASKVGELLAARAADKGISSMVFDRNGYIYGGRIRALADGAREAGLKF